MENTFHELRTVIMKKGNSTFPKVDNLFSNKMKLETVNTMLLLEENDKLSQITMSFFEDYVSDYYAFRIENKNQIFKLIGRTFNTDIVISDLEHRQEIIKIFEREIEN